MPWIDEGDVLSARYVGSAISFTYRALFTTCYLGFIFLDSIEAQEHVKYYDRFRSARDAEVYDAIGEYFRTH